MFNPMRITWGPRLSCEPGTFFGCHLDCGLFVVPYWASMLVYCKIRGCFRVVDINFILLDKIAGIEKLTWQSLLGAALTSYDKMLLHSKSGLSETSNFMRLAKRFKSSSQVLSAVADFLDSLSG